MPDTDEQAAQSVTLDIEEIQGPLKEAVKEAVREVLSEATIQFDVGDGQSDVSTDSSSSLPGFGTILGLLALVLIAVLSKRKGLGPLGSEESGDEDSSVDVEFNDDGS